MTSPRCHVLIEQNRADPPVAPGEIRAFARCRDERLRLPAFLRHYRALGVNRFFIVDNGSSDGTVDWYTFSGFRRYHSECHVCHGPDGEGSTYAPGLIESLKTMSYADFMLAVASGREVVRADKQSKMPALGDNPNVMCYLDDIYVYLKARADGALPRGRPAKRVEKPATADAAEKACFGGK